MQTSIYIYSCPFPCAIGIIYEVVSKLTDTTSNCSIVQLKINVSSHATRNAKSGSNSRGYRHDELNYQLPSVLFRFSTHNAIFLLNINFLEVRGEISHKRTCPDCRTLRT